MIENINKKAVLQSWPTSCRNYRNPRTTWMAGFQSRAPGGWSKNGV